MRLTVDLAAKFSAYNVMDSNYEVHREGDSRGKSAFQFVEELVSAVVDFEPDLILVEDVPYGISSQAMVKPVLRLQGILIHALGQIDALDHTIFVNPSTWQKEYKGVARGPALDRIEAARFHADFMGYQPPNLVAEHIAALPEGKRVLKKDTNPLEKTMTDYIDAFLMARWSYNIGDFTTHVATKGCQRVFI